MRSPARTAGSLVFALVSATVLRADAIPPWDQSSVPFGGAINITGAVIANDFVLASATTISGATIWLADSVMGDNATLDSFGGSLGWAIYTASGGAPSVKIQSGPAVNVTLIDAGQDLGLNADVFQISFELSEAVPLAPGTYFLAIHEGSWGSGDDGSMVSWAKTSVVGAALHYSTNLGNPGSWVDFPTSDVAFSLYGSAAAWPQSLPEGSIGWNISSFLTADDVTFEAETSFSTLDVWLVDGAPGKDDGVIDLFNGTLSWGIYDDAGGGPGNLLLYGTDPSPDLADTGRQSLATNSDLVRARIHLGRQTLPAGTYWIALHEGAWGALGDGSSIFWDTVTTITGAAAQGNPNPAVPSFWSTVPKPTDTMFILFDDQLFASGFEADGACAWTNGAAVDCP